MNIACILADKDYPAYADRKVYGLGFVERFARQFREFGFKDVLLVSDQPQTAMYTQSMNLSELTRFFQSLDLQKEVQLFLVAGNVVMDDRLIRFTRDSKEDMRLTPDGGFVKISGENLKLFFNRLTDIKNIDQLIGFVKKPPGEYAIKTVNPSNFESYIEDLRLNFVPYFFQVEKDTDMKSLENHMYEANFKGTMDFIATYIYKYPVREITRFLSHFSFVTPNQITFLSIVSSFAVPLLFALGFFGAAIIVGWCMFIFDSVDGKLARLTVRLSRTAGLIEHATSAPAIFLWFVGLTWHFTDHQFFDFVHPGAISGWTLMILYGVDKGVNGIFRMKFKREIYDFSRLDKLFHLIACRRASIMLIITVGYFSGNVKRAFYFLAFWMICSFLFHLFRAVWISLSLSKQKLN